MGEGGKALESASRSSGAPGPARVPRELVQVAAALERGEEVSVPVRRLLAWFDETRRSSSAIEHIARALRVHGISCVPDFADAWIDEAINLRLELQNPAIDRGGPLLGPAPDVLVGSTPNEAVPEGGATEVLRPRVADPTNRVGAIAAAHRPLESVLPDEPLSEAISIMQLRGVRAVPITERGDRKLHGVVTWRSVAEALLIGPPSQPVRRCAEIARECSADADLFEVARTVGADGLVFVRGAGGVLFGPVTLEDLVAEFGPRLEPFLLAGEVEIFLRRLVEERCPDETQALCAARGVVGQKGLTLGECQRVLQEPASFARAGLPFSRRQFDAGLDDVRLLRNELMHFNGGEAIDPKRIEELRSFVRALRRSMGARP